jgi:type II secretory pathway pseudopilin PulG
MKINLKNQKGIGLIEVLISLSILGVGILGLLQAFPHGTSIERDIELTTISQHLAQSKLEEIVSLSYSEVLLGQTEDKVRVDTDPNSSFYDFKRSTYVNLVDENLQTTETNIGMKKVLITLYWPSTFLGPDRSYSLTTVISSR